MSNFKLYDIEVFRTYFQIGIKDFVTKDLISFEVSELKDDREEIYDYFSNLTGYLVHFNGIYYDNLVIAYFLTNADYLMTLEREEFNSKIKDFSDKVIDQDNNFDEIKQYKWFKKKWIDIDLFLYWSKMLRLSKKISLKSLGIQLGYPVVQELPYTPDSIITKDEIPILREYNLTHDLGILDLLCTNMQDEIKLRANINKEYNLPCFSWDAPKIASEALLSDYCSITHKNTKSVKESRYERSEICIRDILKDFNPNFRLPIFKDLYERILNSVNSYSEDLLVEYGDTLIILTYGIGGLKMWPLYK